MVNKFIKTVAVIVFVVFIFLTAADTFIKTCGDLSEYSAEEKLISQLNALSRALPKKTSSTRIMTYNLLSDGSGFEGSYAPSRASGVCEIFDTFSPDVVGLQETSRRWFACILNNTDYKFIHSLRTGIFENLTSIIYNPKTTKLIKSNEFAFENGDDSRLRRVVWGLFERKADGKLFIVLNTHLNLTNSEKTPADNSTALTQAQEIIAFCKKMKETYKCTLILTGDFNAKQSTASSPSPVYDVIHSFFNDTKTLADKISHGENKQTTSSYDRIFISDNSAVKNYCIISQKELSALSDHYPVFADIEITEASF